MELGFSTMNTPEDVRPDVLGRELESRGYTSLFIGEHSHIPASRLTPYPAGGDMPRQYRRMMDPFVSLSLAAAATERLQLGLGVCLVLEHHVLDREPCALGNQQSQPRVCADVFELMLLRPKSTRLLTLRFRQEGGHRCTSLDGCIEA